jgi:hypothetical protein
MDTKVAVGSRGRAQRQNYQDIFAGEFAALNAAHRNPEGEFVMAKRRRRVKKTVKPPVSVAQKHITRRIGAHQRAQLKRSEARKKER